MDAMNEQKLTFGLMLGPTPPWRRMEEQAAWVESLGFDKLWLPDHFVNPEDPQMAWFECWTSLASLAGCTERIRLGTLVSSMTLRNPALLARMALTVDHISGGRLEFGVGAGGVPNCHTMTGVPQWTRQERSERYREFIEILDAMLKHEQTTYQGKYYVVQEAIMRPAPLSRPRPVFNIAAHGPRALKLAAIYGDAWNTMSPGKGLSPEEHSENTRRRCEKLCAYALDAGRDPNAIGRTMLFGWTSDPLFDSMDTFYHTIRRYREVGINDFCFILALGMESWRGHAITSESQFLRIAEEALPAMRRTV